MLIFFRSMLRDKLKLLAVYVISTVGLLEMYVALFPAIKKQSANFDQMIQSMPEAMFKAFGMDPANFSFGSFETYMSSEYMSFLWPVLAISFAISLANYIAVRESDDGTIETLLSLPVRRSQIFVERFGAGMFMIIIFSTISMLAALPLAWVHNVTVDAGHFVVASVGSALFATVVFSIGTLCSVLFSARGRATMIASGILVLMYALNIISGLNEHLQNMRYLSIFNYFNGSELLGKAIFPSHMFTAFGGIILVTFVFSVWRFSRRDYSA